MRRRRRKRSRRRRRTSFGVERNSTLSMYVWSGMTLRRTLHIPAGGTIFSSSSPSATFSSEHHFEPSEEEVKVQEEKVYSKPKQ